MWARDSDGETVRVGVDESLARDVATREGRREERVVAAVCVRRFPKRKGPVRQPKHRNL